MVKNELFKASKALLNGFFIDKKTQTTDIINAKNERNIIKFKKISFHTFISIFIKLESIIFNLFKSH